MKKHFYTMAFLALYLTGCTMGENYKRPDVNLPDSWLHSASMHKHEHSTYWHFTRDKWWHIFGDTVLNDIVETGIKYNQDLKIALYRIDASKAALTSAQSSFFPDVKAGFTSQYTESSANTKPPLPSGASRDTYSHSPTLNLSYEIDFWGKIRRLSESAEAKFLGTVYAREQVRINLTTQIVSTYFDLRALQEQLSVAKRTVVSRHADLKIRNAMFEAGTISMLDLMQMKAEAFSIEAKVPEIEIQLAQTESALSILLGENPRAFDKSIRLSQIAIDTAPPPVLPSDLLSNRPDIIAAEEKLIAANADLGAAKAAYFPSVALTSYAGLLSADLSKLGKSNSTIFNGTASALLPVFDAGFLSAQEDIAKAQKDIALLEYDQTIKNALKETEDSLISLQKYKTILHYNQEQFNALKSATDLAEQRYSNGISSYIEVLDAQRNFFQAELNLITGQRRTIGSVVTFIKAIGGGFKPIDIHKEYFVKQDEDVIEITENKDENVESAGSQDFMDMIQNILQ